MAGQAIGFTHVSREPHRLILSAHVLRNRHRRFASFEHDHTFIDRENGTVTMSDELRFTMPFRSLGNLVGEAVLVPHIRELMRRHFTLLKRIAEGEEWRNYLPEAR